MKLIEAYGTGISKIISCYKGLPVQPKFENVEDAKYIEIKPEDEKKN
jgi:ATP-dependent DNA helicase RecG